MKTRLLFTTVTIILLAITEAKAQTYDEMPTINPTATYITDDGEEESDEFYHTNIQRIATNLKPLENAKTVIDQLKQDGNEIYIIPGCTVCSRSGSF